jgi:DNA polymerase-3 subunit gamma/tau
MAYQVIARKYRPQRFSDVVGQEHVSQTLSNAIEQKRIAHAYLFCGPRGTGKTTIARIFAKCLNCTGGPKVDFDDKDPKCIEIAEGRSLDVLEIDGASNNGVEQVRELRETCKYAPASSKFKIYIIDEVHMLSTAAFNALLKTLEEPPEHVKFLFATTDPEKVLPTILSRCQRYDLRRIPVKLIAEHLASIAKTEKVKIDSAALHAIARGAEGAMRDAESTLDQLISFCGDKIQENDVLSMFGLTAQKQLLELAKAVLSGEVEIALRLLNDLSRQGKDLGRLVTDLLSHFRNLLIFQVSRGDLTMIEAVESEIESFKEQAKMASAEALTRIMEIFADTEMSLRDAASKKILVEVALLKAIEARKATSIDSVLKQLEKLRDGGTSETKAATGSQPASAPKPKTVRTAESQSMGIKEQKPEEPTTPEPTPLPQAVEVIPVAASAPAGGLDEIWNRLMESVGRASPFIRSYLVNARAVSFEKNVFVIGFDPEFEDQMGLVDNARNHTLLQTKLSELGHAHSQVKFIKAESTGPRPIPAVDPAALKPTAKSAPTVATARSAATGATPPAPPREKTNSVPFNKEDFKNDPLIQKALEVFKGTIVEVRA